MKPINNKTVHLEELPYTPHSCELFEQLLDLPGAAFLDSSFPYTTSGRFDVLTANPVSAGLPTLAVNASEAQCRDYYQTMGVFHKEHYRGIGPAAPDIPFCGGLLGYIGYDSGKALHKIPARPAPAEKRAPAVNMHAYDWCVVQDHLLRRSVLVAQPGVGPAQRRDLLARLGRRVPASQRPFTLRGEFVSNLSEDQYRLAFEQIQRYIRSGDCYQVNLAQCLTAPYEGDPWVAYKQLRAVAAAPYSGYLALPEDSAVMSLSPERFISLHGHHVEAAPIKGTRPRYADPSLDQEAAAALLNSDKDRAENLMIVDLLRNDLGRSCVPGSIHVDRLFELKSFPTVHHLVSTISGELREGVHACDLLRDSFPGGSITGAPKRRAMEIIDELEPCARQVYCGSLVYISADGRMDSNIAIRTMLCQNREISCWAGGGIVADSVCQNEYQETYDKVGKFLNALESTRGKAWL